MQLRSVAVKLKGDEPRFLQWTKSVGLARVEEYREYVARCAARGSTGHAAQRTRCVRGLAPHKALLAAPVPTCLLCGRFKAGTPGPVDPSTAPKRRPDLRKPTIELTLLRKVLSS